jgi:uncharacterized cupredoxin-like copper-binding protein
MGRSRRAMVTAAAAFALFAAACSSDSDRSAAGSEAPSPADEMAGGHGDMDMGDSYSFGMPGTEADVDRTIEIEQFDDFRFEPDAIEVVAGETIRFDVTNRGIANHEFVLGDESFQEAHEAEMSQMGSELGPDEPYAIGLEPGTSKSLIWTFTDPMTVLFGCHVAGHYEGGMVGTIEVSAA